MCERVRVRSHATHSQACCCRYNYCCIYFHDFKCKYELLLLTIRLQSGVCVQFLDLDENLQYLQNGLEYSPESLEYLRMRKLRFINAIYNLLTKFLMEKIRYFHFFNFLTWYEVQSSNLH